MFEFRTTFEFWEEITDSFGRKYWINTANSNTLVGPEKKALHV